MSYLTSDYRAIDLSLLLEKAGPIAAGQGAVQISVAHMLLALVNAPGLLPEDGAYGGRLTTEQVLEKLLDFARRKAAASV